MWNILVLFLGNRTSIFVGLRYRSKWCEIEIILGNKYNTKLNSTYIHGQLLENQLYMNAVDNGWYKSVNMSEYNLHLSKTSLCKIHGSSRM